LQVELKRSVVNVAVPAGTTPAMVLAAGCINGAVSRTLTAPTDRLRAVLATGLYPNLSSAVRGIVREQGVVGLWNANTINVIRVTPGNGIMFALNDLLKDKVCADPSRPTMSDKFLLGSVAGAASMSAVYPLYVVQSRMAAAPASRGVPRRAPARRRSPCARSMTLPHPPKKNKFNVLNNKFYLNNFFFRYRYFFIQT
jgi:hypothetical protein